MRLAMRKNPSLNLGVSHRSFPDALWSWTPVYLKTLNTCRPIGSVFLLNTRLWQFVVGQIHPYTCKGWPEALQLHRKRCGLCTQHQKNSTPAGADSNGPASLSAGSVGFAHSAKGLNLHGVSPAGPAYPAVWGTGLQTTQKVYKDEEVPLAHLGPGIQTASWLSLGPEGGAGPCLASSTLLLMPWAWAWPPDPRALQ